MAENSGQSGTAADAAQAQPRLTINTHYVKDLSFESPNAPIIFADQSKQPNIQVQIEVAASRLQDRLYEVVLQIRAEAKKGDRTAFIVELSMGALASLGADVKDEERDRVLLIDAAQLVFPFARALVADVTRDGGFPPLLISPVDFARLYAQQRSRAEDQQQKTQQQQ